MAKKKKRKVSEIVMAFIVNLTMWFIIAIIVYLLILFLKYIF